MPTTSPDPGMPRARRPGPVVRRREVLGAALGAAGLVLVAGCTSAPATHPRPRPTPTGPDPQVADLDNERVLLASYDAVLRAHPTLAGRLRAIRADHAAHVTALSRMLAPAPGHRRPTASSTAPAPTPPPVPADPVAALGALRAAERSAAAARTRSCLSAATDRAATLGSIAASEASHEVLLDSPGSPSS